MRLHICIPVQYSIVMPRCISLNFYSVRYLTSFMSYGLIAVVNIAFCYNLVFFSQMGKSAGEKYNV
jgi:hypothetical protein